MAPWSGRGGSGSGSLTAMARRLSPPPPPPSGRSGSRTSAGSRPSTPPRPRRASRTWCPPLAPQHSRRTARQRWAARFRRPQTKLVQGWPKLWANFRALVGIFSHTVGSSRAIGANPAQFSFQDRPNRFAEAADGHGARPLISARAPLSVSHREFNFEIKVRLRAGRSKGCGQQCSAPRPGGRRGLGLRRLRVLQR
jgi:hypothetical protein